MPITAIDFWDLDYTLYSRKPITTALHGHLSEVAGCSIEEVDAQAKALPNVSFTLERLFAAVHLPEELWEREETQWFATIQERATECILPGMLEILEERSLVAQQVLVTTANVAWQTKKFAALTPLHRFFAEADRHFVAPDESKGKIIASYTGSKIFIDDSPEQLHDAKLHAPDVRLIRTMWPSEHRAADPGDGKLWAVATNADELRSAFATVNKTIDG